jgi:diguanylate cyclase (GGDEF)-like protein
MNKTLAMRRKGTTGKPSLSPSSLRLRPSTTTTKKMADREDAILAGEQAVSSREEVARLREEVAELREKALRAQEEAARIRIELGAVTEAHLREANERLVLAAVHAQTMKDAAEQAAAQMAYMAEHDFLTGLPNRTLLTARLDQSIALAQRHGRRVALMYLDLDHFKEVNDTRGHVIGDQLLQSAAKRLQACVRVSDTVCRQGGDEFVVLLAEVDAVRDAALTAEKLIEAMAEPHIVGEHRLHVTLSVGISVYPDDGENSEAIVRNADIAMYHAKRNGRNNSRFFTPDINARALPRPDTAHEASGQHSFVLHYQPKTDLDTATSAGSDALHSLKQAMSEFIAHLTDQGPAAETPLSATSPRHADAMSNAKDYLDALLDSDDEIDEERASAVLNELGRIGDNLINAADESTGFFVVRSSWRLIWALQHVLGRIRPELRDEKLIAAFREGSALTFLCSVIQAIETCHEAPVSHGPAAVLTPIRTETVETLKQLVIARIHEFKEDGILLDAPELPFILIRWKQWESPEAAAQWVGSLLTDRTQLLRLIPGFLTQGRAHPTEDSLGRGGRTGHSLNLKLMAEFIDLDKVAATLGGRRQEDRLGSADSAGAEAANKYEQSVVISTFNAQYPLFKQGKDPDSPWDRMSMN